MPLSTLRLGLCLGSALIFGLAACSSPAVGPGGAGDAGSPSLALYRSVLARVEASYVEPVGADKLIANSLKGMLTGLDPHSDYMTEGEYEEMLDDIPASSPASAPSLRARTDGPR
ncbi:MAG: hypothetical protein ACREFQ_20725 [Stellaceae bacterium]